MTVRRLADTIIRLCGAEVLQSGDIYATTLSGGTLSKVIPGVDVKDVRLAAQCLAGKGSWLTPRSAASTTPCFIYDSPRKDWTITNAWVPRRPPIMRSSEVTDLSSLPVVLSVRKVAQIICLSKSQSYRSARQ